MTSTTCPPLPRALRLSARASRAVFALALVSLVACDSGASQRQSAASKHRQAAEAALAKRDLARAQLASESALSYDPTDARLRDLALRTKLEILAVTPLASLKVSVAEFDYHAEILAQRDPRHAALYATVRARLATDQAAAEAFARTAIAADAAYVPAHSALGLALLGRGDVAGATAAYDRALELDPADPIAIEGRGQLALDASDFPRAIQLLDKAATRDGARADLRISLGRALLGANRLEEAGGQFQVALRLAPTAPEPALALGDLFATANRPEDAEQAYAKAAELGGVFGASVGRASLAMRRGDFSTAGTMLESLAEKVPQNAAVAYEAGASYDRANRPADAARLYGRYAELAAKMPSERVRLEEVQKRVQQLTAATAGTPPQ